MSFCRFGADSDVYVFHSVHGVLECCGCWLDESNIYQTPEPAEMVAHLRRHIDAGHQVPEHVIPDIEDMTIEEVTNV